MDSVWSEYFLLSLSLKFIKYNWAWFACNAIMGYYVMIT